MSHRPHETKALLRYLFGSQSNHYLSVVHGNFTIASTCLKLLSSGCFDPALSDETIRTCISSGAYVLQSYAISQWLEHVKNASTEKACSQQVAKLCYAIDKFIHKRVNINLVESVKVPTSARGEFQSFQQDLPIYEKLMEIDGFMKKRQKGLCLQDGKVNRRSHQPNTVQDV